jgi:hypothetical protein
MAWASARGCFQSEVSEIVDLPEKTVKNGFSAFVTAGMILG